MADETQESAAHDPSELARDPDGLKRSHERYGNYLKKAGLPFEAEEFDEEVGDGDEPPAATGTGDSEAE